MKNTLHLLLLLSSVGICQAQNFFRDNFSTYQVNQELSGQGSWSNSPIAPNVGIGACLPPTGSTVCSGTKVVAQPISYADYGSSPNSITLAAVQDGVAHAIAPVLTDGNLYVGMVMNITTAPTTANSPVDFLRVINSDPTQVTYRMLVRDAGFGYNIGIRKGSSGNATAWTNDVYTYGDNVMVVLKYTNLPGIDDDIVSVYVNPNMNPSEGEPLAPNAFSAAGADQSGAIDRLAFRMNYNVVASMPAGFIGLVSAAAEWSALSFSPLGTQTFAQNQIHIAPSVRNNTLDITASGNMSEMQLNLYTATGSLLEQKVVQLIDGNSQIHLSANLSSGVYIAELVDEAGIKKSFKIISQ